MCSDIELSNVINKCPAIILAVNRTDNVIGRIKLLVVSIRTINEANIIGEFIGTKWENILFILFIHP